MRRYALLLVVMVSAFADNPDGGCAAFAKGVSSTRRVSVGARAVDANIPHSASAAPR